MIIKNLTHKRFFPKKMMAYVADGDKSPDFEPIYWNIPIQTEKGALDAFHQQDRLLKKRSNGNRLLHDILSFSPEDSRHLNHAKLQNLCMEYLRIRAGKNIAFAQIHQDRRHFHIHIIISPNEYGSDKVSTFTRKEYFQVRKDIERYQRENYSELEHSIVFLKERSKEKSISDKEFQQLKRTGKRNVKSLLKEEIKTIFDASHNKDEFYSKILSSSSDMEIYTYRGKNRGILLDGKKYTFRTLGITKDMLDTLDNREMSEIDKRLKALGIIRRRNEKDRDLDIER